MSPLSGLAKIRSNVNEGEEERLIWYGISKAR
jgi:hypothetical protein